MNRQPRYTIQICPVCGEQALNGYDGPYCPNGHIDDTTDEEPNFVTAEVEIKDGTAGE